MSEPIKYRLESFFWRWAQRRSPRASAVTLRHRSIYVLPSKAGLGFFLAMLLLWLLGTNYQNNLILAVSFMLIALFLVAILHAFRNLAGLRVEGIPAEPGFVGERVELAVELTPARGCRADNLLLALAPELEVRADVAQGKRQLVHLPLRAEKRGWLRPPRLLIKSYYPLGITRVWSWVHLEARVLVYPKPLPASLISASGGGELGDEGQRLKAEDDFIGFSQYQPGASMAQVAWKLYARGAGLHLKHYGGAEQESLWLDFDAVQGDVEQRLSGLCFLALKWHRQGRDYGLKLPSATLNPATGDEHLHRVLKALALYNLPETD